MSFFNKALASIGIGNAKVDTRLKQSRYRQGDLVEGEIFIQAVKWSRRLMKFICIWSFYIFRRARKKSI